MDEILKILEKDGRQTPEEIAAQLQLPVRQVAKKIAEYEKKKVIIRYKAVINDELVPQEGDARALIEVKVRPQKDKGFDGVAEKIYRFPEVVSCMLLSGTYDLLVEVTGNNIHSISNFVSQKLSQIENVQGTVTHFILKKYKENGDFFTVTSKDERLPVSA
ncbi:MAG: Lrp/AsnC family transcriptional regulator [Candidatus Aureabacteria bacterium]|nr:Lrp/AsnC family transcriptional regulator [Candidatus Auribacterota bacterium]